MWVTYKNENNGRTYRMDLSVIPFPHISRENLISMEEMLDPKEVGEIIVSLTNYMYKDKKHTLTNKCQISLYNRILNDVIRHGFNYFKKASNLNNFNGKVIDITEGVETAQNEAIEEKEYKDTTSTSNASNYPIRYSENEEYDEVTVNTSIETDDEEERNVVKYSDFEIANNDEDEDDSSDDEERFRQLLRENDYLMDCMSCDGMTKYSIAYNFLAATEVSRERLNAILSAERRRRNENKWIV